VDSDVARDLFDANAETYDRANTIVSLGLDARWRAWTARRAVDRAGVRVLDAFAGTGLVGLRSAALGADVTLADVSPRMLAVAQERADRSGVKITTVVADLTAPGPTVPGSPFDAITLVFGMRYLDDPTSVLRGLLSLSRPGATFVIVDFVEPDGSPLARLAAVYFFRVLPHLASALTGHRELYRELVATTHEMGPAERLVSIVESAGIEVTEVHRMGFGLVCGIVGRRS
jgi:demethylmenaquinone methyltransferase/2-methoxy-6-polyprenyl-1,4-benzoquinol methylase